MIEWKPIEIAPEYCEDQEYYIVYSDNEGYEIRQFSVKGSYEGFEWPSVRYLDYTPINITHWMPLPEPPCSTTPNS